MNRRAVLEWILQDAEANEDHYKEADGAQDGSYDALLRDLESLGEAEPPASLPATPEEAIPHLRAHYGGDVTPISRVLNHLFLKEYLFYKVSKLEEEIFRGFEFFSPVVPEFGFPFPRVGRSGFDRYLKVNAVLLRQFGEAYPEIVLGEPGWKRMYGAAVETFPVRLFRWLSRKHASKSLEKPLAAGTARR